MVQDMFDPEFYMGVYETVDPNTNARVSEKPIYYFRKCLAFFHSSPHISLVSELNVWSLGTI